MGPYAEDKGMRPSLLPALAGAATLIALLWVIAALYPMELASEGRQTIAIIRH
jgi:hypothetical protein